MESLAVIHMLTTIILVCHELTEDREQLTKDLIKTIDTKIVNSHLGNRCFLYDPEKYLDFVRFAKKYAVDIRFEHAQIQQPIICYNIFIGFIVYSKQQ